MKIYFCIFSILILEIAAQDDAAAEFDDFENFENPPEKILSRKKRIDEVNDDYNRKADEHENMIKLKNAENEKLVKNEDLAESEEATHGLYKEAEPKGKWIYTYFGLTLSLYTPGSGISQAHFSH